MQKKPRDPFEQNVYVFCSAVTLLAVAFAAVELVFTRGLNINGFGCFLIGCTALLWAGALAWLTMRRFGPRD